MSDPSPKRIEDYALIGDGETAALVARDGSIEWLCMPRFDSEACFTALLGSPENGCWRMRPQGNVTSTSRSYMGDTLILETVFETGEGQVAVIDFMPIRGEAPDIVRIVEGRGGRVDMASELALRFDYGQIHPLVRTLAEDRVLAIAGPDGILLDFDVPIIFEDRWFTSPFTVSEGERIGFVMTWFPSHEREPNRVDPETALDQTMQFWNGWIGRAQIEGQYRPSAVRSLITLGALIHTPTGGMVAAPTAGLPERQGGTRNWDYRFCWLRDSTFMLLALLQAGMREEAKSWFDWLRRAVGGEPIDLKPFYAVGGDRRVLEWEAHWLTGFNGAQPVRFGNAASNQLQLDIYGEVIDTLHIARCHGMDRDDDSDQLMRLLVNRLEHLWEQPDAGMWENRSEPCHYVYSKVMCWVAFDRAARWFEDSDTRRAGHYRSLAEKVHADILSKGVDRDRNVFTAAYGKSAMDAALLRLPMVGFIEADDPRMRATVEVIEEELLQDCLVRRYRPERLEDGVDGEEGAFLAASFWLADIYALQGRKNESRALFERLCDLANDVGLLSEEHDGEIMLGNFPQGLSHLSLVVTALNLGAGGGPTYERRQAKDAPTSAPSSACE